MGAGAIGAYLGASLVRGGASVALIARGPHGQAMRDRGVTVRSPQGDFHVDVEVTESLEPVSSADVTILAVKAQSLPGLAAAVGARVAPDAVVVGAQNGLPWWYFNRHGGVLEGLVLESTDPNGAISRHIGLDHVIGCVVYCSTAIAEPGVIQHVEGTRFAIGELDGATSERCDAIAAQLVAGGLKCSIEADIRSSIWLKLIGNVAFNPVSALTGLTMGEMGLRPSLRELLWELLEEAHLVAEALGVKLRVSKERRYEAAFAVGDHKTSMLQDLEAGRPLEYQCMTGAIIELAEVLDLEIPRTRVVHALLAGIDPGHG